MAIVSMSRTFRQDLVLAVIVLFLIAYNRAALGFLGLYDYIIGVPLIGILVRFRADYRPRQPQNVDGEASVSAEASSDLTYFGTMRKVWLNEGLSGMYKGLMPTLLQRLPTKLVYANFITRDQAYRYPMLFFHNPLRTMIYILIRAVFVLPAIVLTDRSMTTRADLPWFAPKHALNVLISPSERKRPWTLYKPSLVLSYITVLLYSVYILEPTTDAIETIQHHTFGPVIGPIHIIPKILWIGSHILFRLASAAVLCSLDVIITRMSVQNWLSSPPALEETAAPEDMVLPLTADDVPKPIEKDKIKVPPLIILDDDEDEAATLPSTSSSDTRPRDAETQPSQTPPIEYIVRARDACEPYKGLSDCVRKIVSEEGCSSLFRGWWITFLGTFLLEY
ncbi:hypothetical protein BD410DRAFT_790164 [Rickenella mellea]|uniref:Mitochondrial carrier n=1 Tax=Rickenella mellea TaxID=50990 RepID=A0A4Y7Q2U5_9AGAM|nr:hypothetical protein BD410DRAFT_790164 [Rickenella mellea]